MNTWKQITFMWFSLLVLGLAPIGVAFAQVKVTAANPSSTYQGTTLDVVVTGSGFDLTAKAQYLVSGTTNPGGITVTKVVFRKSTEIVTTISVTDTADLASFDIVVTLDSGRKGKGTTLFSVKAKPNGTVTPTYPPARYWHAFASNGGDTTGTSRLYMFGGTAGTGVGMTDLWSYANAGSTGATWVFIQSGISAPGPRRSLGWSCGGGQCVAANGTSGTSLLKETWIYSESTQTWSQIACSNRRVVCPSGRMAPTMAFDPSRGVHLLFGGEGNGDPMILADTFEFNGVTKTWRQVSGGAAPPAREAAAAVFVPDVGVVMFGGAGDPCCITFLDDMYVWNGTAWLPVASTVSSDPPRAVPRVYGHDMAWDAVRNQIIVTGGHVTSWGKPNTETWYVALSRSVTGTWQATWTLATGIGCQATAGSAPDPVVHAGARMAHDPVAGVHVLFGGFDPYDTSTAFGNTIECR
jgi:hypothetical protein